MSVDLDAARRDLKAFSEMAEQPLTDWQAAGLSHEERTVAVIATRQAGKSTASAVLSLWEGFRRPRARILLVSASDDSAKRLLSICREIAVRSPLLSGSVTDELSAVLRLSNGAEIRSIPSSQRQARGTSNHLVVIDEAAFVDDDLIFGALLPTLAATGGRAILLSSAATASGALFDIAALGDSGAEGYRTVRWVPTILGGDCPMPWLSASRIEADRLAMGELRYRAEMLAEFQSGLDLLFSAQDLALCTADFEPVALDDDGPAAHMAGVDWAAGIGRDRSALV